tara:strand:- start:1596 stop:2570 length:975 start_codon:yes stop_codon:yes gene_type:complete
MAESISPENPIPSSNPMPHVESISPSTKLIEYESSDIYEWITDNTGMVFFGTIILLCLIAVFALYRQEGFMNIFVTKNIDFKDIDMYYINLDRADKRREVFEEEVRKQELQVNRFSAVDGQTIPDEMVKEVLPHPESEDFVNSVLVDDRKNIGHFGCFLSHIGVYQEFMDSTKPYCIIFEDDCEFKTTSFKKDVNKHMGNIPKDWDIVLFGFHTADDLHYEKNQETYLKDNIFHQLEHFTGLHGYMINKRSCETLLNNLQAPSWYLDWEIGNLVKSGLLKVYAVFEPLVCQPACYTIKFDNKHLQMHHILNCRRGGGMATTFSE